MPNEMFLYPISMIDNPTGGNGLRCPIVVETGLAKAVGRLIMRGAVSECVRKHRLSVPCRYNADRFGRVVGIPEIVNSLSNSDLVDGMIVLEGPRVDYIVLTARFFRLSEEKQLHLLVRMLKLHAVWHSETMRLYHQVRDKMKQQLITKYGDGQQLRYIMLASQLPVDAITFTWAYRLFPDLELAEVRKHCVYRQRWADGNCVDRWYLLSLLHLYGVLWALWCTKAGDELQRMLLERETTQTIHEIERMCAAIGEEDFAIDIMECAEWGEWAEYAGVATRDFLDDFSRVLDYWQQLSE